MPDAGAEPELVALNLERRESSILQGAAYQQGTGRVA
jgi:hypothetical protein